MGELIFTFAYGGGVILIGVFAKFALAKGEEKKTEEVYSLSEEHKVVVK